MGHVGRSRNDLLTYLWRTCGAPTVLPLGEFNLRIGNRRLTLALVRLGIQGLLTYFRPELQCDTVKRVKFLVRSSWFTA